MESWVGAEEAAAAGLELGGGQLSGASTSITVDWGWVGVLGAAGSADADGAVPTVPVVDILQRRG